jgi:predicted GNAT family acetyltransferase
VAGGFRVLRVGDQKRLAELLASDPISNCFVAARLEAGGLEPWRFGGEVWGWYESRELTAAMFVGANLIPIGGSTGSRNAFAQRAIAQGRRSSSIVGPAQEVLAFWDLLSSAWGPAREVRAHQPLLVIDGPPKIAADPLVHPACYDDLEILVPACVAMFTEEVGLPPFQPGGAQPYRNRIAELVRAERAYVRLSEGRVVFKAELGAVSREVCQVQGVWVAPDHRGQGLSIAGMSAVVQAARARHSPVVSLYVNGYNAPARAAYDRVGFREVGTFATILF